MKGSSYLKKLIKGGRYLATRKFFICPMAICLMATAYPATIEPEFRVWAGLNLAKYYDPPEPIGIPEVSYRTDWRMGIGLGVAVELCLPESPIGLLLGIGYIRKGSTLDSYYMETKTQSWPYKLGTLTHTGLIQVKSGQKISPYALAGYELSLILSHRGESFAPGATPGETDLKSDTKKLDFGLVAGAGVEFKRERMAPFIELRYHHGLVNLSKGTGLLEDYPTIKSRALVFCAGLRFRKM